MGLEQERGFLKVTVDNPYNEYLLAGQLAATFEALEGVESEVSWESPKPSTTVFTVWET
ncbi:MAG: hypothetical protein SWK76_09665 [Actinomycetota bacterium]|nr:hypothetical protein [Actinomycetota bacterium]